MDNRNIKEKLLRLSQKGAEQPSKNEQGLTIPPQGEQPDAFERFNCSPVSYRVCNVIFGLWACCIAVMWAKNLPNFFPFYQGSSYQHYAPLLVLAVVVTFIFLYTWLTSACRKYTQNKIALIIFCAALLLRLCFLPCSQYVPSSDFASYFAAGCDFALNGFQSTYHLAESFKMQSMAGLSVLNGIIASVFSPTLLGFQVANSVITAGICVFIYKLGVQLNEKGAIAGACLYCVYPASILSSQVTTNQHGATLFLLMGVYVYDKALHTAKTLKKRTLLAVVSAALLLISNFFHASIIITICAILAYSLIGCAGDIIYSIKNHKKTMMRYTVIPLLTLCVAFPLFNCAAIYGMQAAGFMSSEFQRGHILGKVVVGLNPDTRGTFSAEDSRAIVSVPYEQQLELCLSMIRERLKNPELIPMLAEKVYTYTFYTDTLFWFYEVGMRNSISAKLDDLETAFQNGEISNLEYKIIHDDLQNQSDSLFSWTYHSISGANDKFIFAIWGLAVIGLIWMITRRKYDIVYLLVFIPMGWMMFVAISELQSRYRYQSMPIVMLMAGIGIQWICKAVLHIRKQAKNYK